MSEEPTRLAPEFVVLALLMWVTTLVLVGLKLAGILTWSWWWVTSPLWLPVALLCTAIGGAIVASWWVVRRRR